MIVGNGLLASAFDRRALKPLGVTVFASGVSNSSEIDASAFSRERTLLTQTIAAKPVGRLVYFSTCSVTDPDRSDTPYATHKRDMEALVASRPGHIILRLPQVVGRTDNPHTLTNFLADRIRRGLPLEVWSRATRCLIDVDTVAALTTCLLQTDAVDIRNDLTPPESFTMTELVGMMEQVLGTCAIVRVVEKGDAAVTDPSLALALAPLADEDLGPGYTLRTLHKYYGSGHGH